MEESLMTDEDGRVTRRHAIGAGLAGAGLAMAGQALAAPPTGVVGATIADKRTQRKSSPWRRG